MRYLVLLALVLAATAGLLLPEMSAVPEVLSFQEDTVYAGVGPEDPDALTVNATLRNPYPDEAEFLLTASIPGSPTWGLEVEAKAILEPLAQRNIPVKVFIPRGEPAFEESEMVLKASTERGGSWQATCAIRIVPYRDCSIVAEEEVKVDQPLVGSFNVSLRNDGNIGSIVRCLQDGLEMGAPELGPGDSAKVLIPYDVTENGTIMLSPDAEGSNGQPLPVRFIMDGGRVHILMDRISALVLLPSGVNTVKALSIGGDARVISVVAEDGTSVGIDPVDVMDLRRVDIVLDPGKDPIRRIVRLKAIAEMDGEEVMSNTVPAFLVVKDRTDSGFRAAPYIAGGVGGAVLVAAGSLGCLYAAVEGFRYRWLALAFIPLYSIVHGEKVLDHFFRGRLYEYIKENPGVTFTALKKHFEVNNGNLTYHLHKMEREELIVSRAQGKFKLFYPDGIRLRDTEIVISIMDKDIIDLVATTPGIPSQEVVAKLAGIKSKRTVSRHIKDLERKGLLEAYGEHRKLYISRNYGSAIVKDGLRFSLDAQSGA